MTVFQSILLGILQGIAEFLPISSSGHLAVAQRLFGLQEVPLLFDIFSDYLKVIDNYNMSLEIKRLENLIMNEVDPLEQAKISNQIRKLKMGSEKS